MTSNQPQSQNDEPQIDFDLDALQAQINMAMAETEELVTSWVQPTKGSDTGTASGNYRKPKRTFKEMERELKEYLRRPPRLGVGAPIPESAGPTAQEELKLKNRLVGNNNKKRPRDTASSATSGKEAEVDEYNDGEELKSKKGESGSGVKRVRIDPFSLPKKKVKRTNGDGVNSSLNGDVMNHAPVIDVFLLDTPAQTLLTKIETESTSPLNSQGAQFGTASPTSPVSSTSPASPTSAKKKKKKKHKLTSPHIYVIPNSVLNSSTTNGVASSHGTVAIPGGSSSAGITANGADTHTIPNAPPKEQVVHASPTSPTSSTSPTSPSSSTSTKKRKKKKKKHALTQPNGSSILNGVPAAPRVPSGVTSSAPTDDKSLTIGAPIANGTRVEEARAEAEEWTGFGDTTPNPVEDQEAGIPSSPKLKANSIPTSEPHSSTIHKAQAHPGLSLSLPLLNLNGPPHPITNANNNEDGAIQSPKTKKRRRRLK